MLIKKRITKKAPFFLLLTGAIGLAGCQSTPERTNYIECNGEQVKVTYMTPMQQQEVERYALKHEFISGCVTEKLDVLKAKSCQTASTISHQQWMSIYQACTLVK